MNNNDCIGCFCEIIGCNIPLHNCGKSSMEFGCRKCIFQEGIQNMNPISIDDIPLGMREGGGCPKWDQGIIQINDALKHTCKLSECYWANHRDRVRPKVFSPDRGIIAALRRGASNSALCQCRGKYIKEHFGIISRNRFGCLYNPDQSKSLIVLTALSRRIVYQSLPLPEDLIDTIVGYCKF